MSETMGNWEHGYETLSNQISHELQLVATTKQTVIISLCESNKGLKQFLSKLSYAYQLVNWSFFYVKPNFAANSNFHL